MRNIIILVTIICGIITVILDTNNGTILFLLILSFL